MIKGKYQIRKGSLAYYVVTAKQPLIIAIMIIAICGGFTGYTTEIPIRETTEISINKVNSIMETKSTTETETPKGEMQYYNVPLSKELQEYIAEICTQYDSVSLPLVLAIIQRETNYDPNAIGDNGNSLGLMQIQPQWHEARMERLGVTDLLNPYENVTVGIDILAECIGKYNTLEEALTVYNAGPSGAEELYFSKGIKANEYALAIIEIMNSL